MGTAQLTFCSRARAVNLTHGNGLFHLLLTGFSAAEKQQKKKLMTDIANEHTIVSILLRKWGLFHTKPLIQWTKREGNAGLPKHNDGRMSLKLCPEPKIFCHANTFQVVNYALLCLSFPTGMWARKSQIMDRPSFVLLQKAFFLPLALQRP